MWASYVICFLVGHGEGVPMSHERCQVHTKRAELAGLLRRSEEMRKSDSDSDREETLGCQHSHM